MDSAQVATLLTPYLTRPLTAAQLAQISIYIDLLLRWNARTNLTAIRTPEDIVTRHFGESLFAAQTLFPTAGTPEVSPQLSTLLDLGAGAGFPGLPIHLAIPHLQTTLLESNQKKVAFLREVIRALTLTNINVSPARAEGFSNTASTVTLRAVERFDRILPIAGRLVAPKGRLALLIAEPQQTRAQVALPDLTWQTPIPVPNSTSRILLIGSLPPCKALLTCMCM
jgi:16S rRNA (guanine527-N7)-methyltransferase